MREIFQTIERVAPTRATVLLCGEEHAVAWAEQRGGRGRKLDLAEGARQGGADWAGCAEASRRFA